MTITSSASTVTRNGNGATTSFPFPFKVWGTNQLKVFILNAAGEAEETANWTATLSDPGGSVTYPAVGGTVLPAGWKIVINRNMPFTQESDYVNATPFLAETVEDALDKLTATVQQVQEEVNRSVKVDPGNTDSDSYLTEIRAAVASTAADAVSTAEDVVAAAGSASTAAAGAAIITANLTAINNITTNLTAIQNAGTNATTAATKAEEAAASAAAAAADADDAEDARAAAVVAQLAAEAAAVNVSVRYTNPPVVATEGQTVFNAGMSFSNNYGNVAVYLDGIRQATDAYTLASPNIIMDDPVGAGAVFQAFSIDFTAAPGTPLFASQNLADLDNVGTARTNMGLGDAATKNVGTAAGTVAAGDDARFSGAADTAARNLAVRNALKLGISASDASGPVPSGYLHLFLTDELATKTNATYVSASKLYANAGTLSGTKTTLSAGQLSASGVASFSAAQMINGTTAASEGGYVPNGTAAGVFVQIDFGAGNSKPLGKWRTYANAQVSNGSWKAQYSDDGSAWTDAGSGTVDFAWGAWTDLTWAFAGSHRYWRIVTTASASGQGWLSEIEVYEFGSATNMTLIPAGISAGSSPKIVDLYLLHKAVDAITLGTDLKARVTLDGTNWSAYGTLEDLGQYDTNYKLLHAKIDTSALTGTAGIKWGVTTLNNKMQQVRATAMLLNF